MNNNLNHLELFFLKEIEKDNNLTQRELSKKSGVALGLVNSVIKRMINKGLIKISEVHPKRFLYYLTPRGFKEKMRLTISYLNQSISVYRDLRLHIENTLKKILEDGYSYISFVGDGEETEVAYIIAQELGMKIKSIYDYKENNIGRVKFGYKIKSIKEIANEFPLLITNISEEPIIRRKLRKKNFKIYSVG